MAAAQTTKYCTEIKIPEISKLEMVWSSEILIYGIPWNVHVCKIGQEAEQSLGVYLNCENNDETPGWSLWGAASFKLLTFDGDDTNPIEYHNQPQVFDASGMGHGTSSLIKWSDLFAQEKKYVKDDAINLKVEIIAEDPNDPNRCRLNLECLQKCCDNSHFATFRVTVTNVSNMMAVRSPRFTLHGVPWQIQMLKLRSSHLGVLLELQEHSDEQPSKMTIAMAIKLVSSKKYIQPVEKCDTKQYQYAGNLNGLKIISWDDLMKPENGFVNDSCITLEVKIQSNELEIGEMPIAKRTKFNPLNEIETSQMECPICGKCTDNQDLAVTPCGHLFCFKCIKKAITGRAACPTCNEAVRLSTLHQLYFPGMH